MRQRKQIHQGYSFFWGVFLLLVMSAAISIHAEAPFMKELVIFKDTLKNDTLVTQSPKKDGTLVIRDRIPIPSNEPLYIVNGLELPYEIFAALNPMHIESIDILKDASATAIYGTRGINGVIVLKLKTPQQVKEEKAIKQIDELLKPRGVDRRNARYYIDGKEVPASTAYQTNIEQMEVKTGADGTLEIYIKPMIFIRGEYE
ncbi:TonB-dependent receptor plug domain-containing protein [Bacteroides intestinalis]|jgi:TonB-dependent SusC/RagA subfamily outer membrane receptor|uniref:TonB-dependent receptor n=1 Tax=Bacteroides intestinalis TaxID=329854 RepID=A0A414LBE5_9BACE|nr:TonB-dependent receptor plug domain-containing protein [Bacteroides intestinalis]RHE91980.1 TonB-dependent receptor [Bacteroides intestinalis]